MYRPGCQEPLAIVVMQLAILCIDNLATMDAPTVIIPLWRMVPSASIIIMVPTSVVRDLSTTLTLGLSVDVVLVRWPCRCPHVGISLFGCFHASTLTHPPLHVNPLSEHSSVAVRPPKPLYRCQWYHPPHHYTTTHCHSIVTVLSCCHR